jgi:hypothetical protein
MYCCKTRIIRLLETIARKPEKSLCGLGWAANRELALGALCEERTHHFVCCKIPPWHIDEDLHMVDDPKKINPNSAHAIHHISKPPQSLNMHIQFSIASNISTQLK